MERLQFWSTRWELNSLTMVSKTYSLIIMLNILSKCPVDRLDCNTNYRCAWFGIKLYLEERLQFWSTRWELKSLTMVSKTYSFKIILNILRLCPVGKLDFNTNYKCAWYDIKLHHMVRASVFKFWWKKRTSSIQLLPGLLWVGEYL